MRGEIGKQRALTERSETFRSTSASSSSRLSLLTSAAASLLFLLALASSIRFWSAENNAVRGCLVRVRDRVKARMYNMCVRKFGRAGLSVCLRRVVLHTGQKPAYLSPRTFEQITLVVDDFLRT